MNVTGFNHVTIRVSDLSAALSFYRDRLKMDLIHHGNTDAYLEWGVAWVCLLEKKEYEHQNNGYGVDHVAFSIGEKDFYSAVKELKEADVSIEKEPVQRGTGVSFYFYDPDGTLLELHTSNLHERMRVWK